MHSGQRVSVTCNGQTERYPAIKLSDTTLELSRKNSMTIVNAWAENPTATLVVGINGGVCIENIARAANELHMTDVMLSLPHASTDEANVAIVTRLLAVLNPDTRLWVEYSNEVWNFGGPYLGQFNYASRLAEREGITFAQWKGRKTVELEHLLKPLAPDRLRMVIAGQFDVPSQLFSPTAAYAAAGGTDAAGAVASYYTWPLADAGKPPAKPEAPEVEAPVAWSIYRDHLADYAARQDRYLEAARRMAPDQVIDALSLDVDNEADVRAAYQKWMRETGRPILGYEGGFYPSHLPADQKVIDAVHAAINTRRFGLLQAYAMKAWADAGFYCWNESAHCISEHSTRPEKPSLSATISDRYHLDTPRRVIIETVGSN
jgi:hypothetical protein